MIKPTNALQGLFWNETPKQYAAGVADWKQAQKPMPPIPETGWRTPTWFPNLSAAPCLTIDVETKETDFDHGPGWARGKGHIVGFSVGAEGHNFYFPVRHEVCPEQNLDPTHAFNWLRDTLSNPNQPKIGANLLYDCGWLTYEGVPVAGKVYDVQFAEALLREAGKTALDWLGKSYLGVGKETSALYDWCAAYYGGEANASQRKNIYRAPPVLVGPYASSDVDLPRRILPFQWELLKSQGLLDLFEMECALIPLLVKMRLEGVAVDVAKAEQLREKLVSRESQLLVDLKALVGFEVNPLASTSLGQAFDRFGLTYSRTEGGQPSFTKESLAKVEHPLGELVREYRKVQKMRGTFIESAILEANVNGRIYCQFHPLRGDEGGTRSGRLSSSDPNLQQVPSRDEELAPMVRGLFIPNPGHRRWVKFDFSQIEYRGLAHFATGPGADELRHKFCSDPKTDYHVHTQQLVRDRTGKDIPRKPIKNINFGLIFGMGKSKLTRSLGLSADEGEKLFAAYHEAAPFAHATMDYYSNMAQNVGYVTTILGRRSRFDMWSPEDFRDQRPPLPYEAALRQYGNIRRASVHKGLNRVLQGSAADQMKVAMLQCWRSGVFDFVGVPLLTVHDELDFSDPGIHGADEAFAFIKHTMETALPMRVPIIAEMEAGPDWGHVE